MGTLDDVLTSPRAARQRIHDGAMRLDATGVESAVADLAGRLRRSGVRRGDAVAWQLPNGAAAMLLFRACWRAGAVAVPIHTAAPEREVQVSLAQAPPRLVFAASRAALSGVDGARIVEDLESLRDALPAAPPVPPSSIARPADLAAVIFTSGSTGRPKAVLHTHRALAWKALVMTKAHGLVPDDVVLMPAPMAHISGLFNGLIVPAAAGMGSVPMARWDPDRAVDLIEAERVTFMIGPPTFFVTMMGASGFTAERVDTLRLVSSGGATVTPAFVETAAAQLGCLVKRTYGSTEAPTVTTSLAGDDPERAVSTDGRAVGEVELQITDPMTGHAVPNGGTG
ncbi:MAG TPA: long-chain fatty acid--CoA ligase, partial [Acidimicrobiales bacterium]|nr:long-chain fatty acid--CoA ligase [Acidimicrobiales bacterium]